MTRTRLVLLFAILALVFQPLILARAAGQSPSSVTLVSLGAFPSDTGTKVTVTWETGSELNSAGFFILRSTQQNSGYVRLNAVIIPSTGEVVGSTYTYEDLAVSICVIYYYRLEAVDNANVSEIIERDPGTNEIISVLLDPDGDCATRPTPTNTAQVTPSATPTRTSTPTRTATPTNTPIGFVASVTPTPTRTSTLTPTLPPTSTPTQAPVFIPPTPAVPTNTPTLPTVAVGQDTATPIPTATTTLEPLPVVQLLFPVEPTSEPVTPGVTVIVVTPTGGAPALAQQADIPGRLMLLLAVVLILWLGLMVFIVLFIRRTNQ